MALAELPVLTAADFASDQDVRWCPGCGDYSILAQMRKMLPSLGIPREKMVFISGIGCSSRIIRERRHVVASQRRRIGQLRSGQLHPITRVARQAHRRGTKVLNGSRGSDRGIRSGRHRAL